jgi:hypothetical protein
MRRAQQALAGFLPLVDWTRFRRVGLNPAIECSSDAVACFGCGDDAQAVIWLLRKDSIGRNGTLCSDARPLELRICVPGLSEGRYSITAWDTREGRICAVSEAEKNGESFLPLQVPPLTTDLALAISRQELRRE